MAKSTKYEFNVPITGFPFRMLCYTACHLPQGLRGPDADLGSDMNGYYRTNAEFTRSAGFVLNDHMVFKNI